MNESLVNIRMTDGVIECNFDEIKQALATEMSAYKNMTVSLDEIADAKSVLASLRKFRKSLDERRKEVKKAFNEPYDAFEEKVKELLKEIDEPIEEIDKQIKMFDEERALKKKERCKELFAEGIGEIGDYLTYEKIENPKWLNATYSETDIRYDISEAVTRVKQDINVIKSLKSEIEEELLKVYRESGNILATAISRNTQYLADKERIITKQEKPPVENTKLAELDAVVKAAKTVKFIISAEDADNVKEILDFSDIKYQMLED